MSAILEKIKRHCNGKQFHLNKSDYIFQRVVYRNNKFVVYEIMSKAKPLYLEEKKTEEESEEGKVKEELKHSGVIRVTKLPDDEEKIKALFDLFEVRLSMDSEECPDLIQFYDQGLAQYGNDFYYLTRYDDPIRTFDHFINVDHLNAEIEALDCFRLIRGVLCAFAYMEDNGYVLTQFDDQNLYVGSFSEDRGCLFKIMFKGHKDKTKEVSLTTRYKFSPPETSSDDIYKSYAFSGGLMLLYAVFKTNKKVDEFPTKLYEDLSSIRSIITQAADLLYKDNEKTKDLKKAFVVFMNDLLEPDIKKRQSAKVLLSYKYIIDNDKIDYDEYLKEVEANEKTKQNLEKEEEELS